MTEVPEHLLRRAKERRAALAGGEGAAPAASESGAAPSEPAETATVPAVAGAGARAAAIDVPAEPEVAPPSETYIRGQAARRSRVPLWAAPVLLVLPLWAVLYAGAFADRSEHEVLDPLVLGQQTFRAAGCSSCHGARGEGGVGPALAGDSLEQTFPNVEDHVAWVKSGSIGSAAAPKPYGAADRPGGQRMSKGGMPSFAGKLTDEQIAAVVQYEREKL